MDRRDTSDLQRLIVLGVGILLIILTSINLDKEDIERNYNRLTMFTPIYADEEALEKLEGGFDFKGGGAKAAGIGVNANFDWTKSDLQQFKEIIYDSKVDIHDPPRATTSMTVEGYVHFITHDGQKEAVEKDGHECYRAIISPVPLSESELGDHPWVLAYFRADLLYSTSGWGDAEQEIAVHGRPVPTTFKYDGEGPEWALRAYAAAYAPKINWRDKIRRRIGI